MQTWPPSLPQALEHRGFDEALPDGLVRVRTRRRVGGGIVEAHQPARHDVTAPLRGTVRLTGAQWETLRRFHESDLAGGSLPFDFPGPDGSAIRVTMRAPPRLSAIGGSFYDVRLSFDRYPATPTT